MKRKELSPQYLAVFCAELALLARAGVSIHQGLEMLREDDGDRRSKKLLESLCASAEKGGTLYSVLEESGRFPEYMMNMVNLGERTGRLDEVLSALSVYYERQVEITSGIRSAVLYPAALLLMMAAVVVILITRVLPIFNDVFQQMGAGMSGLARWLMDFGAGLSSGASVGVLVLAFLVLIVVLGYIIPGVRRAAGRFFRNILGDRGIFGRITSARFASAMAMGMASGLDSEQALRLAGQVSGGTRKTDEKVARCMELFKQGEPMEKCLSESGIFNRRDSRMLALGMKTGAGDHIMEKIAEKNEMKIIEELGAVLGRIEPALVVIISVAVGAILLSVMLPLMGIMSSLG